MRRFLVLAVTWIVAVVLLAVVYYGFMNAIAIYALHSAIGP